jgi:tetratricopeptide (TPR) repeat protein
MTPELLAQIQLLMVPMKPVIAQILRGTTLVEMAAVERERGRYDEAVRILDEALVLAKPFAPLTGQVLVEKGEVELALERPTRAMVLYEAALPVARQVADLGLQARIFRGMAKVHSQQGQAEQAAEYLERAEALGPAGQENPACRLPTSIFELPPP